MKKIILSFSTLALIGAAVPTASAGDKEWATAGKVLTGLFAARVIADVVESPRVYTYQAPVYYTTPAVVAPQTVVVQQVPVSAAPVVLYPQPVYVQTVPVCAAPRVVVAVPPLVSVRIGGGYCRPYHCWRW